MKFLKVFGIGVVLLGSVLVLPVPAATIAFKINKNGDPTSGGTDIRWKGEPNGYECLNKRNFSYGIDLDGDNGVDLDLKLKGSGTLFISSVGGGLGICANKKKDINKTDTLSLIFSSDVVIDGFKFRNFDNESADYIINGSLNTTTSDEVKLNSQVLPAGSPFQIQLTHPDGDDRFRLISVDVRKVGENNNASRESEVKTGKDNNKATSGNTVEDRAMHVAQRGAARFKLSDVQKYEIYSQSLLLVQCKSEVVALKKAGNRDQAEAFSMEINQAYRNAILQVVGDDQKDAVESYISNMKKYLY
jgi:hypothetical protein